MAISFGKTTRGHGKVYTQVSVSRKGARLTASSTLANGDEVPARILPMGDGEWVLVTSVLAVRQTATVASSDESATRDIRPIAARLESSAHTLLKDPTVARTRNYDLRPDLGEWEIQVDRMARMVDGSDNLHGVAMLVDESEEAVAGDVFIESLGPDGKHNQVREWCCLRDATSQHPDAAGLWVRTVEFSIRVRQSAATAIIWVQPSLGAKFRQGFLALEAHDVRALRDDWASKAYDAFLDPRYEQYFLEHHAASRLDLEVQCRTRLEANPLFSVIVPLYETPIPYLEEMAASVLDQSYSNLELVLVNASPANTELKAAVERLAETDERVAVVTLEENRGITENTNAGIEAATGDFLCFLDHDDTLTLDALFCYAQAISEHPDTDMLYCDEDHIEKGHFKNPSFKPDWSPDLLLGMNYVCHFLCVRKSIVDELEPATSEFDGSQDHHMALRVSERARHVHHVPRVLYHWRVHPDSTANNVGAKPYAVEAGLRAVQAHLDRTGAHATARMSERAPGRYEVDYELQGHPLVSVIIPNKDSAVMLERCLESIRERTDYDNYEVVVVENNSTQDETFALYERVQAEDDRVRVVTYDKPGGFNYSAINNLGVDEAKGEYLLFLNNDTEVISPHWMSRMLALAMRPGTGAVGVKLLYPDETVQHAGIVMTELGPAHLEIYKDAIDPEYAQLMLLQDLSCVTAACMMVSRETFEAVGRFDPIFAIDYNDVDLCLKIRERGLWVVLDPSVELYHYESASRGHHPSRESVEVFSAAKGLLRQKWPALYDFAEPFSNPGFDYRTHYRALDTHWKGE